MKMQIHYKHNMSLNNTGISTTTEKCFTNIELVTNICKFLNYGQQYQLSNVSRELSHIIVNFVWKSKYKEVEILIFPKTSDILVSDRIDIQANNLLSVTKQCDIISKQSTFLKTNELEIFLNLNAHNINKLQLIPASDHFERVIVKFPLKQNFKNLNYLSYVRITLASEDLQKLADNCLKLETLVLCNCLNRDGQTLVLDNDIDIQIIKNMANLKNLIIKDSNGGSDSQHLYTISNIEHILNQMKLQCLNINVHILPDSNRLKKELTFNNLKCCTNFQIGRFVKYSNYLHFQTNILENFENLKNLYLSGYQLRTNITTDLFNILLKSCENLTNLTLDQCRIMDFIALPKLQHLSLRTCPGLTFGNLKTILNEMHLISFSSLYSIYTGDLEYFLISSTLQTFNCDFRTENILNLLKFNILNLRNLTDLTWSNYGYKNNTLMLSNFAPNLKVLYVPQLQLNVEDCFKLKCLQKIVITSYYEIIVSELLLLLKYEHLRDLLIDHVVICTVDVDSSELVAFHCNLISLTVPRVVMEAIADFCLDLLQLNTKLSLTCFNITSVLITNILSNAKFPHRFCCINICGVSIDCISIQEQCEEAMNLIKLIMDRFRFFGKRYFTLE